MTALEFLRSTEAQTLLTRAHTTGGVPLSLHYLERNQEGARICAWGQCAACAHIANLPGGKQSCRQSRQTVSSMSVRQGRALPCICHMGFSNVSVPALKDTGFVLTFGPYCPSEESRSLPFDALAGLNALLRDNAENETDDLAELPFSLSDIHLSPSASIPELAAWTVELLQQLWDKMQAAPQTDAQVAPEVEPYSGPERRKKTRVANQLNAADLVAAVAASNFKQVRLMLQSDLAESQKGVRYNPALASARAVKMLAATLDGLEASALLNPEIWDTWQECTTQLRQAEDIPQLLDIAVRFLRQAVKSKKGKQAKDAPAPPKLKYEALNNIIAGRLPETITLNEVAQILGETPSAITHRLQRKFGLSYSEYLGRMRVDKAKQLLRRTKLSATEIGKRVGINDQSNFGKVFKKYAGMPPQEYRDQFGRKR